MANGSASSPKSSVCHLLDAFLGHASTRGLAPKTIISYEQLAEQAKADFGAVDLRKLTAARLDSYYRGLFRRGLSAVVDGSAFGAPGDCHHALVIELAKDEGPKLVGNWQPYRSGPSC